MFCRHVFGNISGGFRGISRFLGNFAGFRGNTRISRVRDRAKYQKPCLEMSKMICYDLAMGGRAEILKVWLYFRVWNAVGAKIVRWRYRQVPCIQLRRFLTDFLHISFFPLNLQGNPFTIMSLSFFKLTVCARRYSHRRISKWSRLSAARLALDCGAGGRGFDFRGRTNTQGLKITEKWNSLCSASS